MPENRRDVFDEMRAFLETALAQAFRQAGVQYIPSQTLGEQQNQPYTDLVESAGEFILTAELPGARSEDIRVNASPQAVEVVVVGRGTPGRIVRDVGFAKVYPMPSVIDPDNIKAQYRNGILEVKLPKESRQKKLNKEV